MSLVETDYRSDLDIIRAALRAPSAHNAQPWRMSRVDDRSYLLWYAFRDRLLADPDDRDGLMAMGGFYETLRLAAHGLGADVRIDLAPTEQASGIALGTVTFAALEAEPDLLSAAIGRRQCNRHAYARSPLPAGLAGELTDLGNMLVPPARVADLVSQASVMAWRDRRFVTDLGEWTRFDEVSHDGMTIGCLRLSRIDQAALRFALRRGRLPAWLARVYAQRDVRLTRSSAAMAILTTDGRTLEALFDCGRRLVRSWTLINSLGYSWHPMSIVIDQPTVAELAGMIGGRDPVAIYRVGHTEQPAAWSHRRSLDEVLVPAPA